MQYVQLSCVEVLMTWSGPQAVACDGWGCCC